MIGREDVEEMLAEVHGKAFRVGEYPTLRRVTEPLLTRP